MKSRFSVPLTLCFMFIFVLCFSVSAASAAEITWNGGGGDLSWSNPANWDAGRAPQDGDEVVIEIEDMAVSEAIMYSGGDLSINLYCAGNLELADGTLTLTGESYFRGGLKGDGDLVVAGGSKVYFEDAYMYGDCDGRLIIEKDAQVETGGGTPIGRPVVNNGELTVVSWELSLKGGCSGTGSFVISEDTSLIFEEGVNTVGTVENAGQMILWEGISLGIGGDYIQKDTGSLMLWITGTDPGAFACVDVCGNARLDGELYLNFADPDGGVYDPQPDEAFEFLTYGTLSGEFSSILGNIAPPFLQADYSAGALTITLMPNDYPPRLLSTTPANGGSILWNADAITLKFDRPIWGVMNKELTIFTSDGDWATNRYFNGTDDVFIGGNGTDTISLFFGRDSFRFKPGVSYYVLVEEGALTDIAGNEFAGIEDSNYWTFTATGDPDPIPAPTNLRYTYRASRAVTLAWDAPSYHEYLTYDVYCYIDGYYRLAGSTDKTSFIVTNVGNSLLDPETHYTFAVCAVNRNGEKSNKDDCKLTMMTARNRILTWGRITMQEFDPGGGISFEDVVYSDACYGGGKTIAVGNSGVVLRLDSDDDIWHVERHAKYGDSFYRVAYGNGMFVAVGSNRIYTRTSQGEWSDPIYLDPRVVLYDVASGKKAGGGDIFVAVANGATYWSENGVDWNIGTEPFSVNPDKPILASVASDDTGNFVAVGWRDVWLGTETFLTWYSNNGKYWNTGWDNKSKKKGRLTEVAYGLGAFVAGGGHEPDTWISKDKGRSWEQWQEPGTVIYCPTDIACGEGIFVAVAGNKICISENNGYTWRESMDTHAESMGGGRVTSVNYCGDKFVAFDDLGNIFHGRVGFSENHTLTVNSGGGGGEYAVGAEVTITADAPASGKRFKEWAGTEGLSFTRGDKTTATAKFTMPNRAVTVTATYEDIAPAERYTVTVTSGSGGGEYLDGAEVTITADAPASGKQFKEWSGTEGLVFTQGSATTTIAKFTMPARAVTVTATYEDIPPVAENFTVTLSGGGAGAIGGGSYAKDAVVNLFAGSRSSYAFAGWTSVPAVTFTNPNNANTSFMMPEHDVSITAHWNYIGGGDDSGSGSGGTQAAPAVTTYSLEIERSDGSRESLPGSVSEKTGMAQLDAGTAGMLFSGGGTVLKMPVIPGASAYTLSLPAAALSAGEQDSACTFSTDIASVTLSGRMLGNQPETGGKMAEIAVARGDYSGLSDEQRAAVGARPLIQLTLSIGGSRTEWNNPAYPVTVAMPYQLAAEEMAHPEAIIVWYLDGSGNLVCVPNGRYDAATGSVIFTTTHFSQYAAGYNPVAFNDVPKDAWYYPAVSFCAARGITTGTDGINFSPQQRLNRAQLLVMLMRAYSINPDASLGDNFSDAGNCYYSTYLAAAKRLGIAKGVGNDRFAPKQGITRQEMFTMLYNTLLAVKQLPQRSASVGDVTSEADYASIASWAREAMEHLAASGIIRGIDGDLSPHTSATRGEMAQILYKLLNT
ncbi:MAG: InlB B-repeat-containing protein [Dethiobacteria bacterium]|jgi:hypothetical protein